MGRQCDVGAIRLLQGPCHDYLLNADDFDFDFCEFIN